MTHLEKKLRHENFDEILSNFFSVPFLSNLNPIWEKRVWKFKFCSFLPDHLNQRCICVQLLWIVCKKDIFFKNHHFSFLDTRGIIFARVSNDTKENYQNQWFFWLCMSSKPGKVLFRRLWRSVNFSLFHSILNAGNYYNYYYDFCYGLQIIVFNFPSQGSRVWIQDWLRLLWWLKMCHLW